MKKSSLSVFVFGLYLFFLSLGFLIMPNSITKIFGLAESTEVWIRVTGLLLLGTAYYYVLAARINNTPFIRLTVHARPQVIIYLAVFVYLDYAGPGLLIFGVIDLLAAIWTAMALRSESEPILKFS